MTLETELPRRLVVEEDVWRSLLRLKKGAPVAAKGLAGEPAWPVYSAIAGARELVLAQVGQSLDGRVAARSGDAAEISGPEGFAHLHRCRALVDAVVIGVGTAISDDPSLTVRFVPGEDPVRVVIDPAGRLPPDAAMLNDGGRAVVLHEEGRRPDIAAETVALPRGEAGLDPGGIVAALRGLGLKRLLVEGGARTVRHFFEAGLIDRLHISVSPIIIGSGPTGIELPPIAHLDHALRPSMEVYHLGTDVLFDCSFVRNGGAARRS